MDPTTAGSNYRRLHSDRLLRLFAFSPSSSSGGGGDELNEAEIFYAAGDASDAENQLPAFPTVNNNLRRSFDRNCGILAALPASDQLPVLRRTPSSSLSSSSSSTMMIPSIPRPSGGDGYFSQSVPGGGSGGRRFQQSAPVRVPVVAMRPRRNAGDLAAMDDGDDNGGDDDMLPPHEIVARGSGALPNATSFSVLEGVGRTLKGRDLRQVRNAIWHKTGFLD